MINLLDRFHRTIRQDNLRMPSQTFPHRRPTCNDNQIATLKPLRHGIEIIKPARQARQRLPDRPTLNLRKRLRQHLRRRNQTILRPRLRHIENLLLRRIQHIRQLLRRIMPQTRNLIPRPNQSPPQILIHHQLRIQINIHCARGAIV